MTEPVMTHQRKCATHKYLSKQFDIDPLQIREFCRIVPGVQATDVVVP